MRKPSPGSLFEDDESDCSPMPQSEVAQGMSNARNGTAELLDALDLHMTELRARISALTEELQRAKTPGVHYGFPAVAAQETAPDQLRVEMDYAGLTKASFAAVFGVPIEAVQCWLTGQEPIPAWVISSIHLFELLSAAQRNRFLRPGAVRPAGAANPAKAHPFSRIEEL